MKTYDHIWAKSNGTPLRQHLSDVAEVAEQIARKTGLDPSIARKGALLHDIGKASPIFQKYLRGESHSKSNTFRHEIASLFFLSLLPSKEEREIVVRMIIAHHKSVYGDVGGKGLLDLDDTDYRCFERHNEGFEKWQEDALGILEECGWNTHFISIEEAKQSYEETVDYCTNLTPNCSRWKGLLMAADHLASGAEEYTKEALTKLFIEPDLSYYKSRKSVLYPLSLLSTEDNRPHTLVTAPTGAGKTDFLLRRCKGRVFYTLPFQASINAMYDRLRTDLKDTNAQIFPLHASSILKMEDKQDSERILSRHIGASIKVLTPHQIGAVAFGLKGYEAIAMDLKGCDVILDEIHTYTNIAQAMVLKIVEILIVLGCRIHIGTATMPQALYNEILSLLGGQEKVYEVQLSRDELASFDRHIIHKVLSIQETELAVEEAIKKEEKILFVCNRVKDSQELYTKLSEQYPSIPIMLIHSRFKRGDRSRLEKELKEVYNNSDSACIVVSTQVVEVSLDISFDLMVTECAPIDALIQRFGRINRKRSLETGKHQRPIYVIAPPETKSKALPYDVEILKRSFDALEDNSIFHETEVQKLLDTVYPEVPFVEIEQHSALQRGEWAIKELKHYPKSALFDLLQIDSVCCITESDKEEYSESNYSSRTVLEIPVTKAIRFQELERINEGAYPYILPDKAYDPVLGYINEFASPLYYKQFEFI